MNQRVKTAVIGVGHLGRHHARIYHELDESELAGVSDINEKTGRKIAEKFNTRYYRDFRDLLDKVQAVSIVTPTETHFEIASVFLNHGINTLVEKPITHKPDQAEALVRISDKNSCILQVGHVERFNSAIKKAREYINNPRFIEVNRLSKFAGRSLDIGVVLDLMIHDIDIILSFVESEVKNINSIGASVFSDKEDIANCRIEFENGCVANITASRISYKSERKFRVFEPNAYISLDYEKQDFVVYRKTKPAVSSPGDVERIVPSVDKTEPLKEELKDFLECVSHKKEPIVSGYHGLSALKLALEISRQI